MINLKVIFRILGPLALLESLLLIMCVIMSVLYNEPDRNAFIISFAIAAVLGGVLFFSSKMQPNGLYRHEAYLVVALTWVIFSCIGMLPFLFSGCCTSVSSAFFEAMSGFTTTGATVIHDVD